MEDEAVVASVLKEYGDAIELERVEVPGFRFREGVTDWKFLSFKTKDAEQSEEYFDEFASFKDIPEKTMKEFKHFKDTMFASHYSPEVKA